METQKPPAKAYENLEFLHGEEARSVRLWCEYLEPKARLAAAKISRAIVFFGSARLGRRGSGAPADPSYMAAAELAEKVAGWTLATHNPESIYRICSGGGPGIMEAVNEGAARASRALNIALRISLPFESDVNPFVPPEHTFEFHYFFMRKFWFMNLASAFVVFPGGFGTLDELFEVLTLTQTGKSDRRPIILFDRGFWSSTINFAALADRGVISPRDLDLFQYADTADEALALLIEALPSGESLEGI